MNSPPILPGSTIGILGSGQLGKMLAIEARNMGYGVHVLSPESNTPTGQVADTETIASYTDKDAVHAFAQSVSVVTYEFENVPSETVEVIEATGVAVRPGAEVLYVAQNRLREKAFFQSLGIATPPFARIAIENDCPIAAAQIGFPAILKTAGSGYDGKGQRTVRSLVELTAAFLELGKVECILEGFIEFAWEGSVVAARSLSGEFVHYGLVQNDHTHSILDVTTAPAPGASTAVIRSAVEATHAIMNAINVVGVLCVEFFVTGTDHVIANEMAPRPHNSGHWTQDGCVTNQFEQQLRAICGLSLGSTRMHGRTSAMVNLMGDLWDKGQPDFAGMLADFPDAKLHLYGKSEPRPGRKMGHVNVSHETPDAAYEYAQRVRARLSGK